MIFDDLLALGALRLLIRIAFGGYFLFQGLNGVFNWVAWPAPLKPMQEFLDEWQKLKGFMPAVKGVQIISGLGLIVGWAVSTHFLLLSILVFGITHIQWSLNGEGGKKLAIKILFLWSLMFLAHLNEVRLWLSV